MKVTASFEVEYPYAGERLGDQLKSAAVALGAVRCHEHAAELYRAAAAAYDAGAACAIGHKLSDRMEGWAELCRQMAEDEDAKRGGLTRGTR